MRGQGLLHIEITFTEFAVGAMRCIELLSDAISFATSCSPYAMR